MIRSFDFVLPHKSLVNFYSMVLSLKLSNEHDIVRTS